MIILKHGNATKLRGGSQTAPDVTIVHSKRHHLAQWRKGDPLGSDHLLLITEFGNTATTKKTKERSFNYKKADWPLFKIEIDKNLRQFDSGYLTLEKDYKKFEDVILGAANTAILTCGVEKSSIPWWNNECAERRTQYRECSRRWQDDMTDEKKEEENLAKKQLDDCIRDNKKRAW